MHANLIHLGHLHIPVFSAFAVAGLIVALFLSQRTALLAGLAPEAMWDAGVVAALSVFVISRVLLVAFNVKSFLAYPLLLLSLPSVTFTGVLASSIVVYAFLRYRKIPPARFLDAAAPCLALLWAILSLGAFATGSKGMPTTLPWAIEDAVAGPIHPVEVYTTLAAASLCGLLLWTLGLGHRQGQESGKTAATGLFVAGAIAFFMDFLTQPTAAAAYILLDPIQWLGLGMIAVSVILLLPHLSHEPAKEPSHAV